MSYTQMKNAGGTPVLVSNVLQDAGGSDVTVDDNMQDAAGADHLVFSDSDQELGVRTVRFKATATRKFYAS